MGDGDEFDFYSSTPAEGYAVCGGCFEDRDIKTFVESRADSQCCDFCGRRGRTRLIAAPLDQVVDFMFLALDREYQRAIEALGWDGAEGGYQGPHWDSSELLTEVIGLGLPNDDGRLLAILVDCFGDEPWCERNPYSLREDERLFSSWEHFSEFIKHKRRYFFLHQPQDARPELDEYLSPSELLDFIGRAVTEHRLISTLPTGSLIHRARHLKTGQTLASPYDFGPPPVEHAIRSNRMSPAGIVMFYGSHDSDTAVAEIDDDRRLGIAVGTFRTTRDSTLLDLTSLPRRLGFFEQLSDSSTVDRYAISFLHDFVATLAAKVEPGDREHVDYVPTQVVTEWFRTTFRHNDSPLDGICYPSSQRPRGKSVVLFANRYDVVLTPQQLAELAGTGPLDEWWLRTRHERAWLDMVQAHVVRLPRLHRPKRRPVTRNQR